jgi:hypothetical protein
MDRELNMNQDEQYPRMCVSPNEKSILSGISHSARNSLIFGYTLPSYLVHIAFIYHAVCALIPLMKDAQPRSGVRLHPKLNLDHDFRNKNRAVFYALDLVNSPKGVSAPKAK